jgi:hypothetical protein
MDHEAEGDGDDRDVRDDRDAHGDEDEDALMQESGEEEEAEEEEEPGSEPSAGPGAGAGASSSTVLATAARPAPLTTRGEAVLGVSGEGDGKHNFCWLCRYQANRTTNEVIRFIMDAVPHMALDALVEQSKYFLDQVDKASCCSFAQVRRHITEHMLHPRVKLALQLQDMTRMQQEVGKCCVVNDVESGEKTVNTQAMRVYMTLCSQVVGVYKLGEERLTFNNSAVDK